MIRLDYNTDNNIEKEGIREQKSYLEKQILF